MTKTELTKIIHKIAREQIKIYKQELKENKGMPIAQTYEGKIIGIEQFLITLMYHNIIN